MGNAVEGLMGLGFSEYEAKAYLAMLRLGPATGYQIAKASGVPRSTVYQVLGKLVNRGATFTQSLDEMTRYLPVPADLLLARVRREFDASLAYLDRAFEGLGAAPPPAGQAWTVVGKDNVYAMARDLIERAQSEVTVAVGDDDELDVLLPWLRRVQQRGLTVNALSPSPYAAAGLPVALCDDGAHLRQSVGHGLTLVTDRREALFGEVDRSESAVWTTNTYIVAWLHWSLSRQLWPGRQTAQGGA